jgi:hypothetical protein
VAEIFINYRTGDGDEAAEFLAARLSDRFGKEHVFKEGYAKLPLKKYRPIAARNEDEKVFKGRL